MSNLLANLKYGLKACANLEAEFTTRGDKEAVRHFQLRQKQITKQINQQSKHESQ